jgi:hypothetical protein
MTKKNLQKMKHNPNSKKLAIIRLAKEDGEILEQAIDMIEHDECIEVIGQILKYENIWEFEFDDPNEKFMFNLGRVYGTERYKHMQAKATA